MARIILEHEGLVLRDYPLHKGGITIGRGENNAVVLGYPEVSGFHARIDRRGPEYILTDLQSTNGTSVNGRRVFSHRLSHGDRISIGKNSLLFIGTEKAKIEARETKIPLDRTVIIGGVSKHRRTTGTQIATLKDHEIPKVTSSNHPARLLMIVFALTGILVTRFWTISMTGYTLWTGTGLYDIGTRPQKASRGTGRKMLSVDPALTTFSLMWTEMAIVSAWERVLSR